MLAAALIFASALPATAQTVPTMQAPQAEEADEVEDAPAANVNDPDVLKGIDVDKLDWAQLGADASTLRDEIAARKRAAKAAGNDGQIGRAHV